jgi:hypothetical protein
MSVRRTRALLLSIVARCRISAAVSDATSLSIPSSALPQISFPSRPAVDMATVALSRAAGVCWGGGCEGGREQKGGQVLCFFASRSHLLCALCPPTAHSRMSAAFLRAVRPLPSPLHARRLAGAPPPPPCAAPYHTVSSPLFSLCYLAGHPRRGGRRGRRHHRRRRLLQRRGPRGPPVLPVEPLGPVLDLRRVGVSVVSGSCRDRTRSGGRRVSLDATRRAQAGWARALAPACRPSQSGAHASAAQRAVRTRTRSATPTGKQQGPHEFPLSSLSLIAASAAATWSTRRSARRATGEDFCWGGLSLQQTRGRGCRAAGGALSPVDVPRNRECAKGACGTAGEGLLRGRAQCSGAAWRAPAELCGPSDGSAAPARAGGAR